MTEQDKLIDRIKKLLALAQSPVQAEAEAAMAKAQEMMIRHNISVADTTDASDFRNYTTDTTEYDFAVDTKYINDILKRFFFVDIIKTPRSLIFQTIGTKDNVEIAQYMRGHIRHQFDSCWQSYKANNGIRGIAGKASYFFGLWSGLCDKLDKERTRLNVEEGLIVVRDKKLDDFIASEIGKVKAAKSRTIAVDDHAAKMAGHADGQKIQLQAGLRSATVKNAQTALRLAR